MNADAARRPGPLDQEIGSGLTLAGLDGWSGEFGEFHSESALDPPPAAGRGLGPGSPRPSAWWLLGLCLLGAALTPSEAGAQSARTTIMATATVAAEETYTAFAAGQQQIAREERADQRPVRYRGVQVVVSEEPKQDPRARGVRVVSVFFPGT